MKAMPIALLSVLLTNGAAVRAVEPWPAEAHTEAVQLTALDSGLNTVNWSGAFWNPATRTLWLACNSGYFWALVEGGPYGIQVATNAAGTPAKWISSGDFESICQAGLGDEYVYVMDENGYIREFDVSQFGVVSPSQVWDIRAQCPEVGGASGGEGLAFVPDEFLRRQHFCDSNGVAGVSSNGMGGLMFWTEATASTPSSAATRPAAPKPPASNSTAPPASSTSGTTSEKIIWKWSS